MAAPNVVLVEPGATSGLIVEQPKARAVLTGLERGARGRCPNCGQGRLFRAYLKIRPVCESCENDNGQYPADDAPPYFTILIVGHLVLAPVLAFSLIWTWPTGLVLAILLPAMAAITLALLPIVKGAVVGVLWSLAKPLRSPGAPAPPSLRVSA